MAKYHESIEQLKMDSEDFKRDLSVVLLIIESKGWNT